MLVPTLNFDVDIAAELEAGMAEHRAEVEAIAAGPWPPTFADTIEALEAAGGRLHLAVRLFEDRMFAWSTPEVRKSEVEMLPGLSAHRDAVGLDPRIFARIADLVARRGELDLDAEQACVLDRYHRDLIRAGATLDEAGQSRLREINAQTSILASQYRSNLREETAAQAVRVMTADKLRGLPAPMVAAAAEAAGGDGYQLNLTFHGAQPVLEHLHDRTVREDVWRASMSRGRRGGEHDNRPVITEIAALRAERAGLLGYGSQAEYMVAAQTAGSVAAVIEVLTAVARAAAAAARIEAERHTAALKADGHDGPLQPWDWPYYAAREQHARYAVDAERLQEFFELDGVITDGLFGVAHDLYGLEFVARPDVATPGPDVRVWAVSDADGSARGLLFIDPFSRAGKQGGAWMDFYAEPAPLIGRLPLVTFTLNVMPPAPGAPALLTPLDVKIAFHEFGHALHMLLSDVRYPSVAGINVAHDVVEFPSKFHESLAMRPEVLTRYARHHATGEPIGRADAAALQAQGRDGAAYISAQASANSLLDQTWHALAPGETVKPDAVDAFEQAVLDRYGLDIPAVGFGYRSTFFSVIFDGPYPGTHYSYLWSALLEAIALGWLDEHGGLTRANGQRLRDAFLSRGAVVDPIAALRALTGREPSVEPLLQRRGLGQSPSPG